MFSGSAPPRIESLTVEKKFFWCIRYRVTGVPPPQRTWYFNNQLLNLTETILDLESSLSSKDFYVHEGNITWYIKMSWSSIPLTWWWEISYGMHIRLWIGKFFYSTTISISVSLFPFLNGVFFTSGEFNLIIWICVHDTTVMFTHAAMQKFLCVHTGCLEIQRATHVNDGLYTLVVSNALGEANASVEAQFHKPIGKSMPCIHSLIRWWWEVRGGGKMRYLFSLIDSAFPH